MNAFQCARVLNRCSTKDECVFVASLGDKVHTCVDWLAAVLMRVKIVKAQVLPSVH